MAKEPSRYAPIVASLPAVTMDPVDRHARPVASPHWTEAPATAPTQAARHAASMAAVWGCDYRLPLDAADSTTGCGAMRFRCLAGRSPHSCGRVTLGDCFRCVGVGSDAR